MRSATKNKNVDPLFQLFEHYLFNRSYEDLSTFTKDVASEYLAYLDSSPAHVPYHTRTMLIKDLEDEAHQMLVKKMYGCVNVSDYLNYGRVVNKNAGEEWDVFEFEPSPLPDEPAKKD